MSSLALMRWLESTPDRYDAGMRLLTLGRVTRLHDAIADAAAEKPGDRVLEIGCGTGAVTARLAARGAAVTALDQNPEMMERARHRLETAAEPRTSVEWIERTASEIDALPAEHFDGVVASLSLSEMSGDERAFVLREARLRLRPGGRLVVGDEVRPHRALLRIVHAALRAPQALAAWLIAGSLSRPIPDLEGEMRDAGFEIERAEHFLLGGLALVVGRR